MSIRHTTARFIRKFPQLMLIPFYIYRFFQPKYSIGVTGVIINQQREVLLVEHVFHPVLPWGLPGGWIGFNEDPAQAIERELYEELNLTVEANHLLITQRTDYNHIDIAYLCQTTDTIGEISYELLGYRWHDEASLPRLKSFQYHAIKQAFQKYDREIDCL